MMKCVRFLKETTELNPAFSGKVNSALTAKPLAMTPQYKKYNNYDN